MTDIDRGGLPVFQRWVAVNEAGYSLLDHLYGVGSIELAVCFSKLFWPDLMEREGAIILAEGFDVTVLDGWRRKVAGDRGALERAMNLRHMEDLLPGADEVSDANRLYLGESLAAMWEARLQRCFPGRDFEVTVASGELGVAITFCQATPPR